MKPKTICLFVFDSMSDWEAAHAVAGIGNAQFQKMPGQYQVKTMALRKGLVRSAGGIRIQPDGLLNDLSVSETAMLILPGGIAWDMGENSDAVDVARGMLDAGKAVAAICGATAGLARGGLLDNSKHTSNAGMYLAATGYSGSHLYQESPAVTDENLITASGIMPVDFARHIFAYLDLYTEPVLEAWYGLYKTGQAEFFHALMNAAQQ